MKHVTRDEIHLAAALKEDLVATLRRHSLDGLFICGCNTLQERLQCDLHSFLQQVFDLAYVVSCQDDYTCILKTSTIRIISQPELKSVWPHSQESTYQHLQVSLTSRVFERIDMFNVNLPIGELRVRMLQKFCEDTASRSLIGGYMNNKMSVSSELDGSWNYYFEPDHKRADFVCGRGVEARSVSCSISSATNGENRMCIIEVRFKSWKETKITLDADYAQAMHLSAPRKELRRSPSIERSLNSSKRARLTNSSSADKPSNSSSPYAEDKRSQSCFVDSPKRARLTNSSSAHKPSNSSSPHAEDKRSQSCSVDYGETDDEEDITIPEYKATPLADEMLRTLANSEADDPRATMLLERLGTDLWDRISENDPRQPQRVKERLERLLLTTRSVLQKYHVQLPGHAEQANNALSGPEMRNLINAWRKDVKEWMLPDKLQQSEEYLRKAREGVHRVMVGDSEMHPRQAAHQLTRSCFATHLNSIAINKKFLMDFIQDPQLRQPSGMMYLLDLLNQRRAESARQQSR
jgi:hypothetical protein